MLITKTLKLTFPALAVVHCKVTVIKAVRILTGLGLKESKDIVESVGTVSIRTAIGHGMPTYGSNPISAEDRFAAAVTDLRNNDVHVEEVQGVGLDRDFFKDLRQLAADALLSECDELAMDLMTLIKRHK